MQEHNKESGEIELNRKPSNGVMVPVQAAFGIIVSSLVLVLGAAITISWWASGISTQLGIVVKQTADLGVKQTSEQAIVQSRLSSLELWQRGIDSVGSPALNKRLEEQASVISTLRRDFDIFKALDSKKL